MSDSDQMKIILIKIIGEVNVPNKELCEWNYFKFEYLDNDFNLYKTFTSGKSSISTNLSHILYILYHMEDICDMDGILEKILNMKDTSFELIDLINSKQLNQSKQSLNLSDFTLEEQVQIAHMYYIIENKTTMRINDYSWINLINEVYPIKSKDPLKIFKRQFREYDEYSETLSSDIMRNESEKQKNKETLDDYIISTTEQNENDFCSEFENFHKKLNDLGTTYFAIYHKNSWCKELNDPIYEAVVTYAMRNSYTRPSIITLNSDLVFTKTDRTWSNKEKKRLESTVYIDTTNDINGKWLSNDTTNDIKWTSEDKMVYECIYNKELFPKESIKFLHLRDDNIFMHPILYKKYITRMKLEVEEKFLALKQQLVLENETIFKFEVCYELSGEYNKKRIKNSDHKMYSRNVKIETITSCEDGNNILFVLKPEDGSANVCIWMPWFEIKSITQLDTSVEASINDGGCINCSGSYTTLFITLNEYNLL